MASKLSLHVLNDVGVLFTFGKPVSGPEEAREKIMGYITDNYDTEESKIEYTEFDESGCFIVDIDEGNETLEFFIGVMPTEDGEEDWYTCQGEECESEEDETNGN
jgi:hypothetical protein